jgi:hypothetical protein
MDPDSAFLSDADLDLLLINAMQICNSGTCLQAIQTGEEAPHLCTATYFKIWVIDVGALLFNCCYTFPLPLTLFADQERTQISRGIPDDILATDGTLCHLFSTVGAGTHVATLQHHAVDLNIIQSYFLINSKKSL